MIHPLYLRQTLDYSMESAKQSLHILSLVSGLDGPSLTFLEHFETKPALDNADVLWTADPDVFGTAPARELDKDHPTGYPMRHHNVDRLLQKPQPLMQIHFPSI